MSRAIIASAFVDRAWYFSCRCVWRASRLQRAGIAIVLACAIHERRAIIHQRPFARQHLACRAEVPVAFTVIGEVLAFEGSVATCRLVEHRDVRLDPALMNEPAEHLGRSIGAI